MRSICKRMNGGHSSKRITQLTAKRNRKIEDYLHKASKKVIEICDRHEISTLVIGQNKGWKQEVSLGKRRISISCKFLLPDSFRCCSIRPNLQAFRSF
ncbi:transposase [Mitsuokella sp.]|nr:transposase [uncultured Mitsuokella sp.]